MNYGKSSIKRRARQIDRKPVKVRRKIGVVFGKILLICVLIIGVVGVSSQHFWGTVLRKRKS